MSDKNKDDGGAAFSGRINQSIASGYNRGMSLRDWFAGQIAMGACANQATSGSGSMFAEAIAKASYAIADAMIAERNK